MDGMTFGESKCQVAVRVPVHCVGDWGGSEWAWFENGCIIVFNWTAGDCTYVFVRDMEGDKGRWNDHKSHQRRMPSGTPRKQGGRFLEASTVLESWKTIEHEWREVMANLRGLCAIASL